MLRRLTLGLLLLASAAVVVACSSNTNVPSSGGQPGIGPNFGPNTVYVDNTTQNAVDIFTPAPGPSATPAFSIGGSSTGLNGPQYMTFNSSKQLYVTNFNSATKVASIQVYQTYATGNVLAFNSILIATGVLPRGIGFLSDGRYAVALTAPGQAFTSSMFVYNTSNIVQSYIAGANTGLSAPVGIAVDAHDNIYVGNSGNASVTVYFVPTPSPAPSGSPSSSPSPSPSPTPSPTPSPSGSPSASPSPTPSPTPFSDNLAPIMTFTNGLTTPTGVALDTHGNLYVADAGNAATPPSIVIFNAPLVSGMAKSATITSSAFIDPTDVKVDTTGKIYVVDAGTGPGKSQLLVFAAGTTGNATPIAATTLPGGTATGMALSP